MKAIPNPLNCSSKSNEKNPLLNANALIEIEGFQVVEGDIEKTYTALELLQRTESEVPMLVEKLIPKTGLFALVGSSDVGKSQLIRQLAIQVARNEPFLDFSVNVQYQKVIIISTEDDENALGPTLSRQTMNNKDGLGNIRIVFQTDDPIQYLDSQLTEQPADLVIIDTWADTFEHNLNDSSKIRQNLQQYRKLAAKHNVAIGFLHHLGKRTQGSSPSKDNVLAGQAFEAKVRLVLELRQIGGEINFRYLSILKGNYIGSDRKREAIQLRFDADSLTFTNTGVVCPLHSITNNRNSQGTKSNAPYNPNEISKEEHLIRLRKVFSEGNEQLKRSKLLERLMESYDGIGGRKQEILLNHLIDGLQLIVKEGKDRSPNGYYHLSTDHPTQYRRELGNE